MATQVGRVIRDQNLNVQYKGKTNVSSKQQKKGGIGGRKALNDISNSGKPSALQASRKHNSMNFMEDFGTSKTAFSVGGKTDVSKAPEKVRVSGRKALSDLTNSGKSSVHQQLSKKSSSHDKKLTAVAEEENLPSPGAAIAEERFLHDHQECIKAQRKALDMDVFLRTVGLYNDISEQLPSSSPRRVCASVKPLNPMVIEEMPEPELLIEEYTFPQSIKLNSPPPSPKSPNPLYMHRMDYYFPNFVLMEEAPQPLAGEGVAIRD